MSTSGRPKRDLVAIARAAVDEYERDPQDIGFLARVFAQTALPYKNPGDMPAWGRRNGALTMTVQPGYTIDPSGQPVSIGYPYGTIPRLLLIWMSTEAVRTGERTLTLGESLSDFMRQLGLSPNGGTTGNMRKLRDQMRRLLNARISVHYQESGETHRRESAGLLQISEQYDLWWSEKVPDQPTLIPSYVQLSEAFFREVTQHPIPLDMDTLRKLRGSAMRLDIYAWLTYRVSYLRQPTRISWDQIIFQFGSAGNSRAARHKFRTDFVRHLEEVKIYFPARTSVTETGVALFPSSPHVSRGNRPVLSPGDS